MTSSADTPQAPAPRSSPSPVVLIVRDGWGRNPHPEHDEFNAIHRASTPRCDALLEQFPWTLIATSGEDVGLPADTMGNSEVGHQNLGAGRIVDQESVRLTKSIREETFFDNEVLVKAVEGSRQRGGAVHLFGIASDAGVHGLLTHLYACVEFCRRRGQERVYVHLFTDGRDTGPFTGAGYVQQVEEKLQELGVGQVATLCGRYWAMDRDQRWERIQRAYDALTGASSVPHFQSSADAMAAAYEDPPDPGLRGDEFVSPRTVGESPESSRVRDGDAVIFYNYRGDRPRQITRAFVLDDFYGAVDPSPESGERGFQRGPKLELDYVTLTAYESALNPYVEVAFPKPPPMDSIGGAYLSDLGLRQFRCAETEKYAHVTFFFNDYRPDPFPGERRQVVQSPKDVATYDLKPEMSARQVCDSVLEALQQGEEAFLLVNFANTDMVGHTGNLEAAIRAAEVVDGCVGEIVDATLARGGRLVVTADHGNSEQMWDPRNDAPHTSHTTYPVECIVVASELRPTATRSPQQASSALRTDGRLADILPTVLQLLDLEAPAAMTGRSLLEEDAATLLKPGSGAGR
ncbi:MAG: 2,3-bisphosphoglycerate-independent phosphoglycerate mutase [Acidobacteriota bacterium]